MATYSIKELGLITGIMPHTIRIWEQRYGLLRPLRTDTNIRYYGDEELKKLLNVCELLNAGMKISQVSNLSSAQIAEEIDRIIAESFAHDKRFDPLISQALIAAATFDEVLFDQVFSKSVAKFGLIETYTKVIYPLLVRVGLMWGKGDVMPAQEHFFSNLIKQKLFAAIDALPLTGARPDQTWILFLVENEEHEIGLLFASYILRHHGQRVIYLGSRVPYDNLARVVKQCKATHLYTFFVKNHPPEEVRSLLDNMTKDFKRAKILVSGKHVFAEGEKISKRILWIREIDTLIDIVKKGAN